MKPTTFKFWCPAELIKAKDKEGKPIMRLGGIASTIDEDSDGEFLDPNGFDLNPFMKSGMINWHHGTKEKPTAIIGEPSVAKITDKGLYVEADLYPNSKTAQEVFETAETLEKDSTTRRLGFSIEGKVLKRKSDDPKHADFKKVEKAIITGCAITHQPKNNKTFAEIIKGNVDEEEDDVEEKAITTENAGVGILAKESVDKKIKDTVILSKGQVYQKLFKDNPGITIPSVHNIFKLIETISKMKAITSEDIQKAYSALGIGTTPEMAAEAIEKAKKVTPPVEPADDDDDDDDDDMEKSKKEKDKELAAKVTEEMLNNVPAEKGIKKAVNADLFLSTLNDVIQKAVTGMQMPDNSKYFHGIGLLLKAQDEKLVALQEQVELQKSMLNEFGNVSPSPKSQVRAIERFSKGDDNEPLNSGFTKLSLSKDKAKILNIMDVAAFEKGFDSEISAAMVSYETSNAISPSVLNRLKTEKKIEFTN